MIGLRSIRRPRVPSLFLVALVSAIAFGPAAASIHAAPVAPDPNSLLRSKRVMFLTGAASDHHLVPRQNAVAEVKRIKSLAGMASLTLVDRPDDLDFADLDTIDVIVCSYVSKIDTLADKPFGKAFRRWLATGKRGWMGMHNTGANSAGEWNWFRDSVAVMRYREHKDAAQPGTVNITADASLRALPVLQGLDAKFTVADEWYSFDLPPKAPAPALWTQCRVLYSLDENSVAKLTDKMGTHPVAWIREDALGNRFFYTLLVHSDAGSATDFYHGLMLRGLEYASGYRATSALPARAERNGRGTVPGLLEPWGIPGEDAKAFSAYGWRWNALLRGRIFPMPIGARTPKTTRLSR
jgi:type 1 glutamine amidotransferase